MVRKHQEILQILTEEHIRLPSIPIILIKGYKKPEQEKKPMYISAFNNVTKSRWYLRNLNSIRKRS